MEMLEVLLITSIGVLLRVMTTLRGVSIYTMEASTSIIRITTTLLGLLGLFNNLIIYPFKKIA